MLLASFNSLFFCIVICSTELKMRVELHVIFTGTTAPMACPQGSWSNASGLRKQEDCAPCLGGFYCNSVGLTKPSGPCIGGYTLLRNWCSCAHVVVWNFLVFLHFFSSMSQSFHALMCVTQVLLRRASRYIRPYWWSYGRTVSWGILLPRGHCSTCALWSRDICCCHTCYAVWALCARLVLCVRLAFFVSYRCVAFCLYAFSNP